MPGPFIGHRRALLGGGGRSQPRVFSVQPDATAGVDVVIDSANAVTNYGTLDVCYVGESNGGVSVDRFLIKFDLSTIPANAIITSATLSLYCLADLSSNARTMRVYRSLRAWVEAEATWTVYSGINLWQTLGGFGALDCEQTDIGFLALGANETVNAFKSIPLRPTTKAGLDLGNGWLIKMDTETDDQYQFATSDNATAANRPKLAITYQVPA